jgi:hypothetical protein
MLRLLASWTEEEQAFAVPEGEARLGRDPGNDLVLDVRGVSRRHALVRRCLGGIQIQDLDSKNGLRVEGQRVDRVVLTPGLRVQVGEAWIEVEVMSSSDCEFARLSRAPVKETIQTLARTLSVEAFQDPERPDPSRAALLLAYRIAEAGAGLPGQRADLLLRVKAILGADVLVTFERRQRGGLHVLECEGELQDGDKKSLSAITSGVKPLRGQVIVRRTGPILLAGRDSWFLAAKFADESLSKESWRKEFACFLAHRFFLPMRRLAEFDSFEVRRVLALTEGNRRRTASLLGISPGRLYKLLKADPCQRK